VDVTHRCHALYGVPSSKMGEQIMDDIDKNTVDMVNNFDDTLKSIGDAHQNS
jgi:hypothetical protein